MKSLCNHHQEEMVMSAYIQKLRESVEDLAPTVPQPTTLREKLISWFTALPAPTRNRPFSMLEFEVALGAAGRNISPILIELGWQRKRLWTGREHYHRVWNPPQTNNYK